MSRMKSLDEYIQDQATTPVDWNTVNQVTVKKGYEIKRKEKNKEYHNARRTTISGRAAQMFHSSKHRAARKRLEFDLDKEWIIERLSKPCPRTNMPFSLVIGWGRTWNAPSIDRIDNTKGYIKENCQIVVDMYNMCKSTYHENQVLEFAKAVVSTHTLVSDDSLQAI